MTRRKKWILGIVFAAVTVLGILSYLGIRMSRGFEPYIREQAVEYLRDRFDSEVELRSLSIDIPRLSPLKLFFTKGAGVIVSVRGEGILMRHRGRRDIPPMFQMESFAFHVDLGRVFDPKKSIAKVELDGMEINIPPKGDRPGLADQSETREAEGERQDDGKKPDVVVEEVVIRRGKLSILPKVKGRIPLLFDLHEVRLQSAGASETMQYQAELTNPKPPGQIHSKGTFGPWNAEDPGDTPLTGDFLFENADLGVFKAIAGTLRSTGSFKGTLSSIDAKGHAEVPNFRLKRAGNPVPLKTDYEVLVDGTNGNTTLRPVRAVLGSTRFVTGGGIIKHDGDQRRTISLDVDMPEGQLVDVLRLALKGEPPMAGKIQLKTRIDVPPLTGKVVEKLLLDGKFTIRDGKFLKSNIQDKLDGLSRRAQGQPKNEAIDEVFADMRGTFRMEDEVIHFRELAFKVPGADIQLAGSYDMDKDDLDFHGELRLRAKVSQTMSGWKRWALKPVDPIFAKNGAGTFLRIQVVGPASSPQFGRDKGDRKDEENKDKEKK